jgi:hypothetical protein
MKSLTVILPTRGRPDDLIRTLRQTLPHVTEPNTRFLVCADEDDPELALIEPTRNMQRVIFSVRPRDDSRGEKYDRALTEAPGDLYLAGHDCVPILTPGFDHIMLEAAALYPDGIGCVYTPMLNASFPALQAITAKMVDLIGYIYSHDYPFWFIDHELDDIARMTGRYVCVDVQCDVASRRPGKTIRLRDLDFWTSYFDAMTLTRRNLAHRIIDALDAPPWQKQVLRMAHPPIEARSYWINGHVRDQAKQIEAERGETGAPDEGYLRLKIAASERLHALAQKQA